MFNLRLIRRLSGCRASRMAGGRMLERRIFGALLISISLGSASPSSSPWDSAAMPRSKRRWQTTPNCEWRLWRSTAPIRACGGQGGCRTRRSNSQGHPISLERMKTKGDSSSHSASASQSPPGSRMRNRCADAMWISRRSNFGSVSASSRSRSRKRGLPCGRQVALSRRARGCSKSTRTSAIFSRGVSKSVRPLPSTSPKPR